MPCLSCLETIQFYAGLLLRDASTAEKQYRIQDVLQHLDLTQHQHTIVCCAHSLESFQKAS